MSEVGVPAAAAATHNDLPAPPEQINVTSGPMKVDVTLPSGEIASLVVDKSTPVMDFIVQLTRAHKLSTTDHILTVLSEETGRPVDFASGQLIGPLLLLRGRKRLSLLSKAELKKEQERKTKEYRSAAMFETTYRVLVNLPRGVKAVYRMRLDLPVSEAFKTACAEKGLDPARHFVSLPGAPAVPIDMATPLAACGKNEICIVERPSPSLKANGTSSAAVTGSLNAKALREDTPQTTALRLSQLPSSQGESTRASIGGESVNRPLAGSTAHSQSAPGSPQIRSASRPSPSGAKPSRKKYAAPPPPPAAPTVASAAPASASPANGPPSKPMTAELPRRQSQPNGQLAAAAVPTATEPQLQDEKFRSVGASSANGGSSVRSSASDGPGEGCGRGSRSRHNSSDASSVSDAHSLASGVGAADYSSAESCSESMPPPPPPLPGALAGSAAVAGSALDSELMQQQANVDYDSDELAVESQAVIASRKASTSSASSRKSAKARAPSLPLRPPSPEIEISAL